MQLNVIALGLTIGLFWAAAVLLVGIANLIWPNYGGAFLALVASVYPGYRPGGGLGSVVVAALYGLLDGAIGGAVFAWIYNRLAQRRSGAA